jgi:CheY-like chemotaxis protein
MNNFPAVLYVEDDARSRKVMEVLLKANMKLPHVTIFESSASFLERLQALDPVPDVILLDIHVKPHSGFEMLHMLRQSDPFKHVPVVALTASVMNEEVIHLKEAGFDSCLSKPIDSVAFPSALKRIMSGESLWRIV